MPTIPEALAIAVQHHQAGQLAAAEQVCRQILAADSNHAEALHLLGLTASRRGNNDEAAQYIRHAIALHGTNATFHSNLGAVLRALGNLDEAVASCRRALELNPDSAAAHYNLANAVLAQENLDEAVASYRRALALNPNFAEAHSNLGTVLLAQQKPAEAVDCCRRALELRPNDAAAHYNLGIAFQAQGKLNEAIGPLRRALQLNPNLGEAHFSLGTALQAQGKLDEAVVSLRSALALNPNDAASANNLGIALHDLGDLDAAVACFRRTLDLNPNYVEAHNNLGRAQSTQQRFEEAIASFRRALALKPDYADAHYNLGTALQAHGNLDEAIAAYRRAIELNPDHAAAHNNLGTVFNDLAKFDEAIASYRQALQLNPDYADAWDNLLLASQYRPGTSPTELLTVHTEYELQRAAPLRELWLPHENNRDPNRPLRLGFVSPDFGLHPVGFFLVRVLENLDRNQCETICYSSRNTADEITNRFQSAATTWRDVRRLSDEQLCEQIRADRIDILFDLSGHIGKNRLPVFARKPAPIQVTWAGYAGTTGLKAIDYILADRYEIPEGAEAFYSERVLRLPDGYVCYDPPAFAPQVSPLPALKTGSLTFGSFNNPPKINRLIVAVWARILSRVPGSRLVLKYRAMNFAAIANDLANEFATHGIDPHRIEFLGWSPQAELLAEYIRIDVALDPFPYSGGLTTCEALWMGVPVITCPGETFASRHSLSHLSNVGLTETIARDFDEYVELAVSLASDLPRLATLRAGLRQRVAASPLCDGKQFAENLIRILRNTWRHWCLSPRPSPLAPLPSSPSPLPDAVFHSNLGAVFRAKGMVDEAVAACRRALELNPDYPKAHLNLGAAFQDQAKLDEAIACFRRALELKPDYPLAYSNLGNTLKDVGKLDEAIRCFRHAIDLKPDLPAAHRNLLYTLWYYPSADAATIYEAHARWNQQWAEPLAAQIAAHANDPAPNRRLRIGYVSPDFRNHCQALFTVPLFSARDHQQFEIFCYADVANPDALTTRLQACVDQWRDIVGHSDEQIAQMVRQDQIDILVDLTMHMERGHLLTFARKPAPVQVCWLAYPGTTGLKTIDYRLTDPFLDPPGLNDSYYSEQSIRLPDCFWCYDPLTDGPPVNSLPALSNGHITFGCLNNFCKVNSAVLQLWARVLTAVEQSRLLLLAPEGSARNNVVQILGSAGISPDRITFVARQPRPTYLELYNQIDIGLDTFPYNGHTTSLDSFWMGVLVVTLVGQTVVGRAGLCQLKNLDLPDLIAHTPDQFVEISTRLANDLPQLAQLRATLRDRIEKSPLMDAPRFARNIEAAYRTMWHSWCAAREGPSPS